MKTVKRTDIGSFELDMTMYTTKIENCLMLITSKQKVKR